MEQRTKVLALRLWSKTISERRGYVDIPSISFNSMGVAFHDKNIMDLRNMGICVLSSDKQGLPGIMMCSNYADMSISDFQKIINK